MYVPMPVLAAIGIALLALALLALRRRGGERDLIAPPPPRASTPSPHSELFRAPTGGAEPAVGLPAEIAGEVRALVADGRKIEAIKRVRRATGLGLAEAKALVERM